MSTTSAAVLDAPTAEPQTPAPRRWSLATKTGERTALALLLIVTAVGYLWNITVNGMGNQFYAAAVWAGSRNWEALLFGSIDPHNVITVDKPPLSQWVMALSGQIFGFSSASMLIPEALMAVGSVWLLYAAVRRISGPAAGLLAGAVLALTPVSAMMFRFNNPDAAMVLLMTLAAYFTVRALKEKGAKWMALAGVALGFAFLAKMLEGLMVMPALGLTYLIAAPIALRSRLWHLLGALAAMLVSAGWFVVLTILWPASSRPYMAGSTDNTFMNLVLGYNGFGRVLGKNHMGRTDPDKPSTVHTLTGEHAGHAAGEAMKTAGHHGGGMADQVQGLPRLFTGEFGFEIGWLVPAALLATVLVLISRGRAPRTDRVRAGAILFGGWLVSVGLVLSFMKTNVHPYYCLAVAPAMAAMFAIFVIEFWRRRDSLFHRIGLATVLLASGVWGFVILGRNADWLPALRWVILVAAVAGAAALVWAASTANALPRWRWAWRCSARSGDRWPIRSRRSASRISAAARPSARRTRTTRGTAASASVTTTLSWTRCSRPPRPSGPPRSTGRRRPPVWNSTPARPSSRSEGSAAATRRRRCSSSSPMWRPMRWRTTSCPTTRGTGAPTRTATSRTG